MKVRVAIVDDHVLLNAAFQTLLEPQCEIVGTFSDAREFLSVAESIKPEVVVMDVSMPGLNGLDAARELKKLMPAVRIVFVTMNEDPDIAAEAFRAGASAFLLKRSTGTELLNGIKDVMRQRYYITPLVTKGLVGALVQENDRKPVHKLTTRQREVLQLLAEGRSMKEVAAILHLSARTVAFHKYQMMERLQVRSSAALIRFAVREGLI